MGTNYYAIPKATEVLKKRIIEAIEKNDFDLARNIMPTKIHIGKSSGGWAFCFNHNDWVYFGKSKDSLQDFLLQYEILTEYNEIVLNDDFWQMVDSKKDKQKHLTFNGQECGRMEFGLNFSNSTKFS